MEIPYRCKPDCPNRSAICHAECHIHAEDRAREAAKKAEAQRHHKANYDASSVLIESRQRYKRYAKIN